MRVSTRALTRILAVVAAFAIGALTLGGLAPAAHASIGASAAHQSRVPRTSASYEPTVIPNITYETVDGIALKLDVCLPPSASSRPDVRRPAIVVIHGGSWMLGSPDQPAWLHVCEWIASTGYVSASVGYRLAPEFHYPDALHDVQHAVEWLRAPAQVKRYRIEPSLIGAFGGSAGGNLAALLGTVGSGSTAHGDRVAAVAELSGPSNLTGSGDERPILYPRVLSYLGCRTFTDCPQATRASPLFNVDSTDPPFFIGQSSDELIPTVQSSSFAQRLESAGVSVTYVTVPGHNHSISMLDRQMRTRITEFFHTKLRHTLPGRAHL